MSLDELDPSYPAAAGLLRDEVLLGEPMSEGFREAINDYASPSGNEDSIYQEFLGDPTLRLNYVPPVTDVVGSEASGDVVLDWTAPQNAPSGTTYAVLRASSLDGPWDLRDDALTSTSFSETADSGSWIYVVRAVASTTTTAGSYDNASQGVFAVVVVGGSADNGLWARYDADSDSERFYSSATAPTDFFGGALARAMLDSITFIGAGGAMTR